MKMNKSKLCTCSMALLAARSGVFAADKKGDAAKGKEVFEQCGVCHNADSTEKKMGPGLKGLFTKTRWRTGRSRPKPTSRQNRRRRQRYAGL